MMFLFFQSLSIDGDELVEGEEILTKENTQISHKGNEKDENIKEILVVDQVTQPIFNLDEAIIESVFVETSVDSDNDGNLDRIHASVIRPKETEDGIKVPVIYEITPYRYGLNSLSFYDVDVALNPVDRNGKVNGKPYSALAEVDFPGPYENYFVPRGYAIVVAESIGTALSNGCPTVGDENEVLAASSVIDWLNGRTKAYSEDGLLISADWSTGNVGMIGVSYNGTLDIGVASTGVKGLKTIVPIAAISNWYDYYRANGAVVAPGGYQGEDTDILADAVLTRENPEVCHEVVDELKQAQDRETGDYNGFWDQRNYMNDIDKINASVFIVHGLNDWNVKTKQFSQLWDALGENKVSRKLWLHQQGHTSPSRVREVEWEDTLHKWFDYWLYDIDNGIMNEPLVDIQREDLSWSLEDKWPAEGTVSTALYLDQLSTDQAGVASLIDDPMINAVDLVAHPQESKPYRILYTTNELADSVRISGTPEVSIQASIDQPVSNLTVLLVDYSASSAKIVTRGWMDPQNINNINKSKPIEPNEEYTFTWDMQPDDYVFEQGHRIGIVFIASDYDYTLRPPSGTKVTIYPEESKVVLPIVGGEGAIK
ncbi:Xaa-Pro dipeptidyl-peptidase [Chengkuizengella axinellae]